MKNKVFSRKFCLELLIYGAVFLLLTAIGLWIWWDFIDTYEQSRPKTAVNQYMQVLTAELVCEQSEEFLSQLDTNIQSPEESCSVISEALREDFRTAKKSRESTDSRQVYALLSGNQEFGTLTIQAGQPEKYNFRMWEVSEVSFDLSFLQGSPVEVTVPENFNVMVGEMVLDDAYIVQRDIPYGALEDFYESYSLPVMVTYRVDSFLGDINVETLDSTGKQVFITADTDMNQFLPACGGAEIQEICEFVPVFLEKYINFSGGAKNSLEVNFKQLKQTLATDGKLADLFYSALRGQRFTGSRSDTVEELSINQSAALESDRYFCDISFRVKTIGHSNETVYSDNNMRLILAREADGLKVEAMTRY